MLLGKMQQKRPRGWKSNPRHESSLSQVLINIWLSLLFNFQFFICSLHYNHHKAIVSFCMLFRKKEQHYFHSIEFLLQLHKEQNKKRKFNIIKSRLLIQENQCLVKSENQYMLMNKRNRTRLKSKIRNFIKTNWVFTFYLSHTISYTFSWIYNVTYNISYLQLDL